MTTAEQYERWQRGEAPITECVEETIILARREFAENPGAWSRLDRYAFVYGSLVASVPEPVREELSALIRAGEIR